ncbi:MAG: hypothetical protein R3B72_51900 [Polyangiaceae bacterium]
MPPTALSQVSKQDLLDTVDRYKSSLAKTLEENAETIERTTILGGAVAGSGAAAMLDKKYPNMSVGGVSAGLVLGAVASGAGLMGYGGKNTAHMLVSSGAGLLGWEVGKFVYRRTEAPAQQQQVSGWDGHAAASPPAALPGYGRPAVGYASAPQLPAPTAPRFAEAPARAITLDEVHAHLAQMGLSL